MVGKAAYVCKPLRQNNVDAVRTVFVAVTKFSLKKGKTASRLAEIEVM